LRRGNAFLDNPRVAKISRLVAEMRAFEPPEAAFEADRVAGPRLIDPKSNTRASRLRSVSFQPTGRSNRSGAILRGHMAALEKTRSWGRPCMATMKVNMKPASSTPDDRSAKNRKEFSLVLEGPLFGLLHGPHLVEDSFQRMYIRIVAVTLLTWLPLLVLSFVERHGLGGNVAVPFLRDVDVHVRFLVAMPLLLIAERTVHLRMLPMGRQFLERNLIPEDALERFNAAFASAMRLRNSVLVQVLIIAAVYVFGVLILWRHYLVLGTATWYATPTGNGTVLSLAGIWYAYLSLPLFQFLLLCWYFRLLIWARFLWQVSRIELVLIPTHPDRLGGLGFLAFTVHAFVPLAVAHGAIIAGLLANRIFYAGATLAQFKFEIALLAIYILCLAVGPLLVFTPRLAWAKRRGNLQYGALAERYVRTFDAKWLRGGSAAGEPFIGSADIQSLADTANSFEVVRSMQLVPVTRNGLLELATATLAPIAPLTLSMMPLEELLKALFGILR
jgi:hypothetical protein